MKIINVRSPYIISVNEESQDYGKLELRIWKPNEIRPEEATYTFTKNKQSDTKREVIFNISPFIKDLIENKIESVIELDLTNFNYVNAEIKTFYKIADGDWTNYDTQQFIALNGYTNFIEGVNASKDSTEFINLSSVNEIYYDRGQMSKYYVQMYFPTDTYKIIYEMDRRKVELIPSIGINNIPLTYDKSYFDEGNHIYVVNTSEVVEDCCNSTKYEIKAVPICESIFTPVICSFVNKNGAIQQLTFFKLKVDTTEITSEKKNTMPSSWYYDTSVGISGRYNINGKDSIRINTGFVPESYGEVIKELLLSENIWIDKVPVVLKTQSLEKKTQIRNKNISYDIEFEYAFDTLNYVI